jgi:phosphoglycerate dehydrogenase-like enzyme
MRPTVLFTTEVSGVRDRYFPPAVMARLDALCELVLHAGTEPLTPAGLRALLPGVDACVTHWRCPAFTAEAIEAADRLTLIAHAGGSVADLVTPAVFERGIAVTSANDVMAKGVAEGVLTAILADLHRLPERARLMREGGWLPPADRPTASLARTTVGIVGLGTVGRELASLLRAFGGRVLVHDPFVDEATAAAAGAESVALDDLLAGSDVVTLHAALTRGTRGMLDARRLALIPDGALLVNTARAGLVDGAALRAELASGRIRAVLDVFELEPLPPDSPWRSLPAATLYPHSAGSSSGGDLGAAAVEEIARLVRGDPPAHPVSFERWASMTHEFDAV